MILTFIAPAVPRPVGGVAMIYEFASAMAGRGHDVHLFHVDVFGSTASSPEDVGWYDLDDRVQHHFLGDEEAELDAVPSADVIFGYRSEEVPARLGLPAVFIQGYRMLARSREEAAFRAPCPKVCVARWLVDVGLELGVPGEQLVHVPLGLRHDRYRVLRPIEDRPPRVALCYNAHPHKGPALAVDVLEALRDAVPEVEAVAFTTSPPERPVPGWVDVRVDPPHDELVGDVYNGSRVFLCTSEVEGFGLPNVEAMACGAALVTTDNGGSRDYAVDGETALVAPSGDRDALVAHVAALLRDDGLHARIARAGVDLVAGLDWGASAARLEDFLVRYLADPPAFGRPPVTT